MKTAREAVPPPCRQCSKRILPKLSLLGKDGNPSRYFDQKDGVSTTNRVNISRRPSSMAKVQTQVWKSLRPA